MRPKRRTGKYRIGNGRWARDVLMQARIHIRWTKGCGWLGVPTRGVGECALEISGRRIISSGPGKPVALLYGVLGAFFLDTRCAFTSAGSGCTALVAGIQMLLLV
jgi:hypothetical protein